MDHIVLVSEEESHLPYEKVSRLERYVHGPIREALGLDVADLPHMQHLSVVSLGTYLRGRGAPVTVVDNIFKIPRCAERFREALARRPLAVGVSTSLLLSRESVRRVVDEIRAVDAGVPIILGGRTALTQPWALDMADIVTIGAGEQTLLDLRECLRSGGDLESVPNLRLRRGGRVVETERRRNVEPDRIPPPDWGLLEIHPSRCYPIEASKGCRFNCAFCTYDDRGRQVMKSIDLVVEEIRRNWEEYGISLYRFMDSNLTSWPEHVVELCRRLEGSGIPLRWSCYARVDDFAAEPRLAESMRAAGCQAVFCGIESGDDEVLKKMRKGYGVADILEGTRRLRRAGLFVHGSFVIGFPGETVRTVRNTLDLLEGLGLDSANFLQLMVEDHSDASIARSPELWGLRGAGSHWVHDTMNSEEASALVDECFEHVTTRLEHTVIGDELQHFSLFSGWGLESAEIKDLLTAVRDFHRGRRRREAGLVESARSRIRRRAAPLFETAARLSRTPAATLGRPRSARLDLAPEQGLVI